MRTNASPKIITQAVENVSKKYDNNVVLRKAPEKMTKNVVRFTVKTKDATKAGSLKTKDGVLQSKANWEVNQEVLKEILKLDPRAHIYVDTVYGRQFATASPTMVTEPADGEYAEVTEPSVKRKYTRKLTSNNAIDDTQNIIKALKYLVKHPEIFNQKS